MLINTPDEAKKLIGHRLYWVDECSRWRFERSGVLTDVFNKQLCFGDSGDYRQIRDFKGLSSTPHGAGEIRTGGVE